MVLTLLAALWTFIIFYYWQAVLAYVGVGSLYALMVWSVRLFKLRNRILLRRKEGALPNEFLKDMAYDIFSKHEYPPKVSNNKAKIFAWAFFWPIHMPYTIFADVIAEIFRFLYRRLSGVFTWLAYKILPAA